MRQVIEGSKEFDKLSKSKNWVFVTTETKKARLKICNSCNNAKTTLGFYGCNKCGCLLSTKTSLKLEKCPIDKWSTE